MNVEILGVDPSNRGAGLMFEAVRQQLDGRYGSVRYAMSLDTKPADRLKLGAWGVFSRAKGGRNQLLSSVGERIPQSVLRQLAVLPFGQIDVIMDASGFAYGDFWGTSKMAQRMANHIETWKRSGKAVILMPQAWGAFEKPGFKPLLETIFHHADLVFARDETSYKHLKDVVGERPNLHLAPDFTNLLKPALPPALECYAGRTLIIPNSKIILAKGEGVKEGYLSFLSACVDLAEQQSLRPAFLIHEGAGDLALAEDVNARRTNPVDVISGLSALETKALITHAHAIVSSRFHGLVSALSAGVPSLACGWSHKYLELLKNYDAAEWVIDLSDANSARERLEHFFTEGLNDRVRENLRKAAGRERALSQQMWSKVFQVLDARQRA